MKIEINDQTVEMEKRRFHLSIMRNVERNIPKTVRKRTCNWKLVMDYMLGNTSKGGSTSSVLHCIFMGVDPDCFTFWENKDDE